MGRIEQAAPQLKARIAGGFYLLTIVTGSFALVDRSRLGMAAGLVAGVSYIAVTILFYDMFKPVNKPLAALAAAISLVGIVVGPLRLTAVNPLVFFGVYCLLIGYLIVMSGFLPRVLGVLMACAGVGWLAFLLPGFAKSLYPYNLVPGLLGEGALTAWLLIAGVNVARWRRRGAAAAV